MSKLQSELETYKTKLENIEDVISMTRKEVMNFICEVQKLNQPAPVKVRLFSSFSIGTGESDPYPAEIQGPVKNYEHAERKIDFIF